MLWPLLLASLVSPTHEPAAGAVPDSFRVSPADPLHRLAELEVGPEGVTIEWVADFAGTLHVRAESGTVDPKLRVQAGGRETIEDDDSGGGSTAYVELEVEAGTGVAIQARANTVGSALVHWVASPETTATLATAEAVRELLAEIETAQGEAEEQAARGLGADAWKWSSASRRSWRSWSRCGGALWENPSAEVPPRSRARAARARAARRSCARGRFSELGSSIRSWRI